MTQLLTSAAALAALVVVVPPALARSAGPVGGLAPEPHGIDAYYWFVLGRQLESDGDLEGSIAAHREAARLDPGSSELRAELAGLFARHGRLEQALAEARAALAIDPGNREGNRVLGTVLAALLDENPSGDSRPPELDEAVSALERGRRPDGIDADPSLDLTLARLYLRAGRHERAVDVLQSVVAHEEIAEAWLLLAQAWTGAGNVAAAAEALERGAQGNPRLLLPLGELYERQQRWDRAATVYERAAAFSPNATDVKSRLAGALLNLQDEGAGQRARALLEPLAAAQPEDERTLYMLSQAQRRSRDLEAAEATARRVIALDPGGLWGPWALAQVYEDRRNYAGVAHTLAAALADWTPAPGTSMRHGLVMLTHLGVAQLQIGRGEDAVATFARARSLAGGDAQYDLYLAQAHLSIRQYADALRYLVPLREEQPGNLRVAQLEARALAGVGRRDDAIAALRATVDAHPTELAPYLSLADLLSESARMEEAHSVLDAASARFPADVSVPFQRGALFDRAKDFRRAEQAFREVLARDPEHAPALNYLGYLLADRGERLDEAVALIGRALAVEPQNGSYLDSLGWAYFKLHRYEEARGYLLRAAEQLPANSVVQDHLGDALAALGRHVEAIAAWQRALAGDREAISEAEIGRKIARAREQATR